MTICKHYGVFGDLPKTGTGTMHFNELPYPVGTNSKLRGFCANRVAAEAV